MKKDLAILIGSCDAYEDMWDPFFILLKKYWKNLNYDIYCSTETKDVKSDLFKVRTLHPTDPKCSWTERISEALNEINNKYVLLMLDDFFLYDYVDTKKLDECIDLMAKDKNNACITFYNVCPDGIETSVSGIVERPKDGKYKINAILSLWDKEQFIKHVSQASENVWQWEIYGNMRCQKQFKKDRFYQIGLNKDKVFPYDFKKYGLFSGKWIKDTVEFFEKNKIKVDYSKRGFYEPALAALSKSITSAFYLNSEIYYNNDFKSKKLMKKVKNPVNNGDFKYSFKLDKAKEVILWNPSTLYGFGIKNLEIKLTFTNNKIEIVQNEKLFGNYKFKNKLYMFNTPNPNMFITIDNNKKCKKIEISGTVINPLKEKELLDSYEEIHEYNDQEKLIQEKVYRNFLGIKKCCESIILDSYITYKNKKEDIKVIPKKKVLNKLFIENYKINDDVKKIDYTMSTSTGYSFKNLLCFIKYNDNKIIRVKKLKNLPNKIGKEYMALQDIGPIVIENEEKKKIKNIIIIGKFYSPINIYSLGKVYGYNNSLVGKIKQLIKKILKRN